MRLKVYGCPDPTFDQNPTNGQPSNIAYVKKAISSFTYNQVMQWNEVSVPPTGNPTKSTVVNDLIKPVKMKEICKQGTASQAEKKMEQPECNMVIDVLEAGTDDVLRCLSSAIYMFQTSIIGRIGDCTKFASEN